MTDLARVEVTAHDRVVVAVIEGEVDLSNAEAVHRSLVQAVTSDVQGLVVDLRGLQYLDSAGIRLLFQLAGQLRERRQQLRVVADGTPVRRVLELVSLEDTVPIDAALDDALAAFGAAPVDGA